MTTTYDATWTLRAARQHYFDANRFGDDGGDSLKWVPVKVLGVPLKIPNSDARRRAVRIHDLHHVITGYATHFAGEAEIAAWELASGCANHPAALILNLFAIYYGIVTGPRKLVRAWARGRRTRNLYRAPFGDRLLGRTVGELRAELGLDEPPPPATARDVAGFAAAWLGGMLLAFTTLALLIALVAAPILAVRALL